MGLATDRDLATLAHALRARRRAAGMSQEQLARLSGVSVRTIRNIEGGRVRRPRPTSLAALADALGVGGDERDRIFGRRVRHSVDKGVVAPGDGRPLPSPLTPLVGREAEVAALSNGLSTDVVRLVTVTGVAGVGKSRLALEVARGLRERGRHTWWVPLASIGDVSHVLDAVANAVDAPAVSPNAVAARVRRGPALLALDNLEHLPGVEEVLVDLLAASPALTVLATSRAPIGVPGEQEWPLQPLAVPGDDEVDPVALASVGSVQLLVDRVRSTLPDFALTEANAGVVADICRLLDGLPLAVELAAKQWRVRGGSGLLRSIRRDPLSLRNISDSASPAHNSLLSALGASFELLSDRARRTFARLSVFPADWDVDAALEVSGDEGVVDDLDDLTALGLVVAGKADLTTERRFWMLPIVRAFAVTRADEREAAEAAARHASHYYHWLARASASDAAPRAVYETERDNLRAALHWFVEHEPRAGLRMSLLLSPHWRRQGREVEGLAVVEELVGLVDDADLVARAQLQGATLAYVAGRNEVARDFAARSLAAHRELGHRHGYAEALGALGTTALVDEPLGALAFCRAAVAEAESLGDPGLLAWLLLRLGVALSQVGDLDDAIVAAERALDVVRQHDLDDQRSRLTEILALVDVGEWRWLQGSLVEADRLLESAEPLVGSADDLVAEANWLADRAIVSASLGDVAGATAAVAALDERVTETGSQWIGRWAAWARGELELLVGSREEATVAMEHALEGEPPNGYPLNRLVILAALAAAAADADSAEQAILAADGILATYPMRIPPLVAARIDDARGRWHR